MTKVGQLIEEEKIKYANEMVRKATQEAAQEAARKARRTAENLLKMHISTEEIARIVPDITLEEVKKLEEGATTLERNAQVGGNKAKGRKLK